MGSQSTGTQAGRTHRWHYSGHQGQGVRWHEGSEIPSLISVVVLGTLLMIVLLSGTHRANISSWRHVVMVRDASFR